jgi:hypothetical protein
LLILGDAQCSANRCRYLGRAIRDPCGADKGPQFGFIRFLDNLAHHLLAGTHVAE